MKRINEKTHVIPERDGDRGHFRGASWERELRGLLPVASAILVCGTGTGIQQLRKRQFSAHLLRQQWLRSRMLG